jgi:hypothetical protein
LIDGREGIDFGEIVRGRSVRQKRRYEPIATPFPLEVEWTRVLAHKSLEAECFRTIEQ